MRLCFVLGRREQKPFIRSVRAFGVYTCYAKAFANDQISFEQFSQKVKVFSY